MPDACTHRCRCHASTPAHRHVPCAVTQRWFTHTPTARDGIAGALYLRLDPQQGPVLTTCVVPVVDGEVWGLWRAQTCPTIPVAVLACLAGWITALMGEE